MNWQHLTTDKKNNLLLIEDILKKRINKDLIQLIKTRESITDIKSKKNQKHIFRYIFRI